MKEKLYIATVQTLVFGLLLALFGYWMNVKQDLVSQQNKVLLEQLRPEITARKEAYKQYLLLSGSMISMVEKHYGGNIKDIRKGRFKASIAQLKKNLNVETSSDFGGGGSWIANSDIYYSVKEFADSIDEYGSVSSEKVQFAVSRLLTATLDGLNQYANLEKKDRAVFAQEERERLGFAYREMKSVVQDALGYSSMPIE